jgi:AcrR family transcriptional regulator
MDALAERLGISKGLIYAHFSTNTALLEAVLLRRLAQIAVIEAAGRPLRDVALEQAEAYFDHVRQTGPIVHRLLSEPSLMKAWGPQVRLLRDRQALGLIRLARKTLRMSAREAVGAFTMIMTIPEETGSLAYSGQLEPDLARTLCLEFVDSSLAALAPA